MEFHWFLATLTCLLVASSVFANPIKLESIEVSATRDIFGRDILPLNDAVAQFKNSIGIIRTDLGTIGGTNVSTIDIAQKATDDLKLSYENFHANLEALRSAKKIQVAERGFPFGECGAVKDVGGLVKVERAFMSEKWF